MKTKGHKAFASLRAGVVATVAAALVITPLAVANAAEVPTFGKVVQQKCKHRTKDNFTHLR